MQQPDLELAGVRFKIWSHGDPFGTMRRHFHAECEVPLATIAGRAVGSNNVSNAGRQFPARKRMPPSRFRSLRRHGLRFAAAA